jgi:hypothetical protein
LLEHTFERIFEPFGGETFQDALNLAGEFLRIPPIEMSCNPIKIPVRTNHHQISCIGLAPAVEFHRKQQFSLWDSRRHWASGSEFRDNRVFCQIPIRPLGLCLATAQSIGHCVESNGIADIFLKPNSSTLVHRIPIDIGDFLVATVSKERGIVVDRLRRYDDIDIRREPLIERCHCPPTDEHIRQLGVDDRLQGRQQLSLAVA